MEKESNSTLSFYWDLASNDPVKRQKSCVALTKTLAKFQANFSPKTINTLEDIKTECAPDVAYALKRLMRGLSSSRDGARQGFSVALTEVFYQFKQSFSF
jgi:DNA polymerase phi